MYICRACGQRVATTIDKRLGRPRRLAIAHLLRYSTDACHGEGLPVIRESDDNVHHLQPRLSVVKTD